MKVAIVGAGITGLYLAWKLSEIGHSVVVFEKKEKIGKMACSGLFSQRILEFIPESQNLIQNQIESALIHFPKRTLRIKFSNPEGKPSVSYGAGKFLVMNHYKLDRLVLSLAEKSGAKIILNHNITSLPDGFDRIIGCDGAFSFVRKSLGLPNPVFRLAIQGFIQENSSSNFVETWPNQNQGFIWKIPRNKEIEYGIIAKPQKAQKVFEEFLRKNNLSLKTIRLGLVPQGFLIPFCQTITLCGDAAGLCKPWSGGGVVWGLIAAEILLKNFPDFLKYRKETKKIFSTKIYLSKIATKIIYFLGFKMPWLLPKSVKIEGDFLI